MDPQNAYGGSHGESPTRRANSRVVIAMASSLRLGHTEQATLRNKALTRIFS